MQRLENRNIRLEIKFQDVPELTRLMPIAMEDLKLQELLVVYPGKREFQLAEDVRAISLTRVSAEGER